jgi:ATP phosphoribosyltransferase
MKLALPKGRLLNDTAAMLDRAGVAIEGYDDKSRSYHLECARFPQLRSRVFQERDIPIQVAIGNYDLGICGLDWVKELLSKYPSGDLMTVRSLGYGRCDLHAVVSGRSEVSSVDEIDKRFGRVRIVSEYPNLAESFALKQRLRRFSVLPIVGGGEVYPPESADMALIAEPSKGTFADNGLVPVARILTSRACLIANRNGLARADLSELLACLQPSEPKTEPDAPLSATRKVTAKEVADEKGAIRLAIPDGHLSKTAAGFFDKAQIDIRGYTGSGSSRRPTTSLPEVTIKVIRPQDMPLQVANGNFDLAVTGEDWLRDHLCRFPSSPAMEIVKLGFGAVRVVAVVSGDSNVSDTADLQDTVRRGLMPRIRIASEYVNIADRYAIDNHLQRCTIIPTWGASEAFVPDDADLLIENTETGETLAKHNLKIIDTILESTACLVGHRDMLSDPDKKSAIERTIGAIKRGLGK